MIMSEFNFKSQICTTKEQSERLLALGFKKETADCRHRPYTDAEGLPTHFADSLPPKWEDDIPAWSLHRLIKFAPIVLYSRPVLYLTTLGESVFYCTEDNDETYEKSFSAHLNLYDNMIDCIEWLVSNGYVNKEIING